MSAKNLDKHNRFRSITVGFRVSPEEHEHINKKHAEFTMPELKRTKEYVAELYEGDKKLGISLTFSIERGTKEKNLF